MGRGEKSRQEVFRSARERLGTAVSKENDDNEAVLE